ncbi:hypothetical protein HN695_05935 [Candidatus Woesearchaeota archaeon]|jgi:hypothetical protein|nr:hypothetical protein [Candidatus Woesearchaeota archaeon]MBT5272579.1 hypothetical protein [Candidatus Woesearchaeota archaeon]MBT6040564.1 hypothetical protein [Candidatus Woesearchaeota archaeon]MBT6337131.1 hypothetical protein [Candidatus Woesearchaeota archaeon]MBT7927849.1 hypothetical protein [Candidatus Woesearchaeota archaeon]
MAGNVQVKQVRNLEKKVGGNRFLDRMKKVGQTAKRYATIAAVGAGLVMGGSYLAGCGEESECCKELDCNGSYDCVDHYDNTCECKYDPPSFNFESQEFGLSIDDASDVFVDDTY